jgi:putative colanic acid biosynthesis UDP-glucose lipid carrier transferase
MLSRYYSLGFKRLFDILFSLAFLLTLFPIIYVVLGVIIKLDSRGGILFVQYRVGKRGKPFRCYKFRSMYAEEGEGEPLQATADDSRITRVGRFIRRTNLDELPQFVNVLKGDMSVVGPRPHPLWLNDRYVPLIRSYAKRHEVRPGITGWAQVTGFRGETRRVQDMEGRVARDIWYIRHQSFLLDMRVILRTVVMMFRRDRQAY